MNPSKLFSLSIAALCTVAVTSASAQTATSGPVGFTTQLFVANSDTRFSPPLTRPPEFTGGVAAPLPGATAVVTVAGSPGWTANQFAFSPPSQPKTYYAIFGPTSPTPAPYDAEGKFFTVTANTANTLTIDLAGDSLSSVPVNAQVQLIPYWTLGTLFPAADANVSFIPSVSQFVRQTEILVPNHAALGVDTAVAATYYFTSGQWRKFGDGAVNYDNATLPPTESFTVRNKASSSTLVNLGGVEVKKVTTPLATQAADKQDNFVAIVRPVDVAIKDLGLTTNGAFVPSTSAFVRADEILIYDNNVIGTDKSASATYYLLTGAASPADSRWRKFGAPTVDAGADVIPAGAGFVIRKAPAVGGATAFWVNDRTYNP